MKSGTLISVAVLSSFAIMLLPVTGRAQLSLAAKQVYESAAVVPTNIDGIRTYRALPKGFDPVHAEDTELALYGLPSRPPDPEGYQQWARVMTALRQPATGPLEDMHISAGVAIPAGPVVNGPAGTPSTIILANWSGIANTVPGLTSWSPEKSIAEVWSEFSVPVAEQAFATGGGYVCDGGWDAEASWSGIDGLTGGSVLQGGSYSAAYCKDGLRKTQYYAWVEWYPSYYIIKEFNVNPGDDIFVSVIDGGPTNGLVFVEDLTQGVYKIVSLKAKIKPYLIGKSAEYIVERPFINCKSITDCQLSNLANYVQNYWAGSYAYTFDGENASSPHSEFPGSHSRSTYLLTMAYGLAEPISTAYAAGRTGLFFTDENCAFSGGCPPGLP
jgi:Peptidase A4 family